MNEWPAVLSWSKNEPLTITVPEGSGSYQWYIDDTLRNETGSSLTIYPRDLSAATHIVSARITHDGRVYSNNVVVTVGP
jgi:hypothetical protein